MKKRISFLLIVSIIIMLALVIPAMAGEENVALGKSVSCETDVPGAVASLEGGYWGAMLLTDGVKTAWSGSADEPIGWYAAFPASTKGEDIVLTITIDLEQQYDISRVKVYPMGFYEGTNMPSSYKVLVSSDGENWNEIGSEKGLSGSHSIEDPFVYETMSSCRYVRIYITEMSSVSDPQYVYAGIKEIEVYKADKPVMLGDINGDGAVSADDLTVLARHVAKIDLITDPAAFEAADVNCDGIVDSNDLTMLARYVAKIIPELGRQEKNFSEGLLYELNSDGKTYSVVGLGSCIDMEVIIPPEYQGKKVTGIADSAFVEDPAAPVMFGPTSVIIPDTVQYIGTKAFYHGSSLSNVTIPDSVTAIGDEAFSGCMFLTGITIPDSVKVISSKMLYECRNLKEIVLPGSLTEIGDMAFSECSDLVTITFGGTVSQWNSVTKGTDWDLNAGKYTVICKDGEISNIVPSEGLAYYLSDDGKTCIVAGIGTCSDTDIVIPEKYEGRSVIAVGDNAFFKNKNITSVTFPSGITEIGSYAFYFCTGLTELTIPENVTTLGESAFDCCTGLKEITIPKSVTSIARGVFSDCDSLISIKVDPDNPVYDSRQNCRAIIETNTNTLIQGCNASFIPESVTIIADWAFLGCPLIAELDIPENVTDIGEYAFADCTRLEEIIIPKGMREIRRFTFICCSSVTELLIPDGVARIGESAFEFCTKLESVTLPDSITEIGAFSFGGCESLKYIYYKGTVEEWNAIVKDINWDASTENYTVCCKDGNVNKLAGSEGLDYYLSDDGKTCIVAGIGTCSDTDIVIPEKYEGRSVIAVGDNAFLQNQNIKSVTFSSGMTEIGGYAFSGCTGLTELTIPGNITTLGECAFESCAGLTKVTIPASVTSIGNGIFNDCESLISITVDPENPVYDSRQNCRAIIETNTNTLIQGCNASFIPESVTKIADWAFFGCTLIAELDIPENVTDIGEYAFCFCIKLEEIIIPDGVTKIGEYAFELCNKLESVTLPDSVTEIGAFSFGGCKSLKHIYFKGTVEEWNAIAKGKNWDALSDNYTVCCKDGEIIK